MGVRFVGFAEPVRRRGTDRRPGGVHPVHSRHLAFVVANRHREKQGRRPGAGVVDVAPWCGALRKRRRLLWRELLRSIQSQLVPVAGDDLRCDSADPRRAGGSRLDRVSREYRATWRVYAPRSSVRYDAGPGCSFDLASQAAHW